MAFNQQAVVDVLFDWVITQGVIRFVESAVSGILQDLSRSFARFCR